MRISENCIVNEQSQYGQKMQKIVKEIVQSQEKDARELLSYENFK